MPIELRNDVAPGLHPFLAYLLAQQQQRQQADAQNRGESAASQQAFLEAMNAAAQAAMARPSVVNPAASFGMSPAPVAAPSSAIDPRLALEKYRIDRQARTAQATAGMNFLNNQNNLMADSARQRLAAEHAERMAIQRGQQEAAQRQLAAEQEASEQQRQFLQQQALAQMNADLEQRNKLMQTAPGAIDPIALEEAQQRIQQNREILEGPARAARQKLMGEIASGNPEAIKQGLQQGLLYFSPEQKTRVKQLQEEIASLAGNDRFTPAQKAEASRMLAEELSAIRPMETPIDRLPLEPIEQFHRDTLTVPHEGGGPPLRYKKSLRNGLESWELEDASKEDLKYWHERQNELWKKQEGIGVDDPRIKEQELEAKRREHSMQIHRMALEAKMKFLMELDMLQTKITMAQANLSAAQATPDAADDAAAQNELSVLKEQLPVLMGQVSKYDQIINESLTAFGANGSPPPAAAGLPSPATSEQVPPSASRPLSADPAAGVSEWDETPIGGIVTLPDGSVVKKTGPAQFIRIQ